MVYERVEIVLVGSGHHSVPVSCAAVRSKPGSLRLLNDDRVIPKARVESWELVRGMAFEAIGKWPMLAGLNQLSEPPTRDSSDNWLGSVQRMGRGDRKLIAGPFFYTREAR